METRQSPHRIMHPGSQAADQESGFGPLDRLFPLPCPKGVGRGCRGCIASLVGACGVWGRSDYANPIGGRSHCMVHRLVSSFKRSDSLWWGMSGSSAGPETRDWPRVERDVQCRMEED